MQRRLAAILAADVVDYSRLMGEDQARMLAALRAFRNGFLAPSVEQHGGQLVKNMGDGWIVEFPSISDAVACAVQVQDGLEGHEPIRLRVGTHCYSSMECRSTSDRITVRSSSLHHCRDG